MATRRFPVDPEQAARFLLAFQAGDAVACATVPISSGISNGSDARPGSAARSRC